MQASDNSTKTGVGDGTSGSGVAPTTASSGYDTTQLGAHVNNSGTATSCQVSSQVMSQVSQAPKTQSGPAVVGGVSSGANKSASGNGKPKNRSNGNGKANKPKLQSLSDRFAGYAAQQGNGKASKPKLKQKQPAQSVGGPVSSAAPQMQPVSQSVLYSCGNPSCNQPHCQGKCTVQPSSSGLQGNTQSSKRNKAGGSRPHCNKKAGAANTINKALNEYKYTKVYREAVSKTFKNKAALDAFNLWVKKNEDSIDPSAVVVCQDCGKSDLELCDCWITAAPNAVQVTPGAVLAVPSGPVNIKWRFQWVERVRRMFAWPSYTPDVPLNHNIGWMSNSQLPEDDMVIEPMLCYIRQHMNTSYKINGVLDRNAKLAHCKKLAIRFLDEQKVPLDERLSHRFVACMHLTVQKATDMPDDDFLLKYNNEDHNIGSLWKNFQSAPVRPLLIVGGAIAFPILMSRLDVAYIKLVVWGMKRLATNIIRTWVAGSVSILGLATHSVRQLGIAINESILNGRATPCYIAIQQLSCSIARTTSSTVSRIVSSNLHPSHIMQSIISRWAPSTPTPLQIESTALLNSMGFVISGMNSMLARHAVLSPSMLYCTV